jgi:hypothetical protein
MSTPRTLSAKDVKNRPNQIAYGCRFPLHFAGDAVHGSCKAGRLADVTRRLGLPIAEFKCHLPPPPRLRLALRRELSLCGVHLASPSRLAGPFLLGLDFKFLSAMRTETGHARNLAPLDRMSMCMRGCMNSRPEAEIRHSVSRTPTVLDEVGKVWLGKRSGTDPNDAWYREVKEPMDIGSDCLPG